MLQAIQTPYRKTIGRLDQEEHLIGVDVVTRQDAQGRVIPKVAHWRHGESVEFDYVSGFEEITEPDSDIVLRRYMVGILTKSLPLYHEFYRGEEKEGFWYFGLF